MGSECRGENQQKNNCVMCAATQDLESRLREIVYDDSNDDALGDYLINDPPHPGDERDMLDIIGMLWAYGARLNATDVHGRTALKQVCLLGPVPNKRYILTLIYLGSLLRDGVTTKADLTSAGGNELIDPSRLKEAGLFNKFIMGKLGDDMVKSLKRRQESGRFRNGELNKPKKLDTKTPIDSLSLTPSANTIKTDDFDIEQFFDTTSDDEKTSQEKV